MERYDVLLIGTGAANIVADAALAQGKRVAIVERGRFGGTCLNRGCIPTKILVAAANAVCEIREASRIGVRVGGDVSMDWDTVGRRMRHKIDEAPLIQDYYEKFPNVDTYNGTASFVDNHTVAVDLADGTRRELAADTIVIATGARTKVPRVPGLEETGYVTSETFFADAFPAAPYQSLLILGGGPIGCEFAHVFRAAGTPVTLVQHNVRLLPKEEEEVSLFLQTQFRSRGIDLLLNKDTVLVRREGDKKVLRVRDRETGEETEVSADEILVAPGVRPMTELLHLENTDVALDPRGFIQTNEFLETTARGIYALGDVNGFAPFRHKANYEAEILAHNLFEGRAPEDWRWASYDLVPAVTYTYPEAAHVGLTEAEARRQGYAVEVARNHYSAAAKGYALGFEPGAADDGFVKLVLDKGTRHILGVHIVGHEASLLLQPFLNQLTCGVHAVRPIHGDIASPVTARLRALPLTRALDPRSVYTVSETMTPHPSLSEVTQWTRYYYEKK